MARPAQARAHDHDRLRVPSATASQADETGKKESIVGHPNQLSRPSGAPAEFFLHLLMGLLTNPASLDGSRERLKIGIRRKIRQVVFALAR
jgi:hypothetical protein